MKVFQGIQSDPLKSLAARVTSKLEEGDFRGAVRVAASEDSFAPMDDRTLHLLQQKHPSAYPDSSIPSTPNDPANPLLFSTEDVVKAIFSFPSGSAAGHDGLRPQHLKDLITKSVGDARFQLTNSLVKFVNLVVSGQVPSLVRPFFFHAKLIGLSKKDDGVRPIAIGSTLRRLVGKCISFSIRDDMHSVLAPLQLSFGTPSSAEAVVHAACTYLSSMNEGHLLLKLDFKNAFNSIRQDKMLTSVSVLAPLIYPLVHAAYSQPSLLFFGDAVIHSEEDVQQGDPLGPLPFCLAIHDIISNLNLEFSAFYLDDSTLAGFLEDVKADLAYIENAAKRINLELNCSKSEMICIDYKTQSSMLESCKPHHHRCQAIKCHSLGIPHW